MLWNFSAGREEDQVESPANAAHVDACGVRFPRLMSDAYAFEHRAASAISESLTVPSLGRISRRNSSVS
jgi:hypothetical protein